MATQHNRTGTRRKNRAKNTSVTLEEGVIEYLDQLAEESDRSRSWLINNIIKAHAERLQQQSEPLFATQAITA